MKSNWLVSLAPIWLLLLLLALGAANASHYAHFFSSVHASLQQ